MSNKNSQSEFKQILPGLLIATAIGFSSIFLSNFIPKLGSATISIFLGMILGNLFLNNESYQKGYKYAETNLLSYSIVLLGATLSIPKLFSIGLNGLLMVVIQMIVTICGVLYLGKKLNFSQNFSMLMASGNAVCGSSAIAATSPVIDADDKERGIAITIVNVIGIFLMFLLPLLGNVLYDLEELQTSALIGSILQSVGQVVASGSMVSEEVKDISMIFKIVRVILLVAVVFLFGHMKNKQNAEILEEEIEENKKGKVKVPWYVIGFFITCGLFSVGIISDDVSHFLKEISNKLEIIALAGIGLRVDIKDLLKQGKAVTVYAVSIAVLQITSAVILIGFLL